MNEGANLPMLLIHHAAHRGFRYPPSSLSGLADCLAAGAQIVEMDITPLADGDFALVHDSTLETASDGQGPVAAATAAQVAGLHLRWRGALTGEPVGLLSQAVELLAGHGATQELQLDLKPHAPLTDAVLERLLLRVEPVKRRVRTRATAAKVPRTVAMVAEIRPTRKVTQIASSSCSLRKREAYQRVEKPPQTVTSRLALNE